MNVRHEDKYVAFPESYNMPKNLETLQLIRIIRMVTDCGLSEAVEKVSKMQEKGYISFREYADYSK